MNTAQIQIRVSISEQLGDLLKSKAQRLGIPLTQFVKHLLITEVKDEEFPIFQASDRTIQRAKKAMQQIDKSVKVTNIHEYFKNL